MADSSSNNPGCLTALLQLLNLDKKEPPQAVEAEPLPYRLRDDFLSVSEISFYHVLSSVIPAQTVVCPKVRLADVFFVARPNENLSYFNRIVQHHIDFLVCESQSIRPLLGIELDDASHKRASRKTRDEFVDAVFDAAGLPLIHLPVQMSYNTREIAARVTPYLTDTSAETNSGIGDEPSQASGDPPADTAVSAPFCPKCRVPMVVRVARRGQYQGSHFYGCPNYPQCREVAPFSG
jgi:hypothetical protein